MEPAEPARVAGAAEQDAQRPIIHRESDMLVLGRNESQRLFIGDNIVVTVVEIRGNLVRLGIEAPLEVPIVREEANVKERRRTLDGTVEIARRMADRGTEASNAPTS